MSEPSDWTAPDSGRQPGDPAQPQPGAGGPVPGPHARPKPGVIPLRPLGVGEILDGAVSYIRANPAATLGLSAVVITITSLIQLAVEQWLLGDLLSTAGAADDPDALMASLGPVLGGSVVSGFISFIATTVLSGLLIVVLSQAVLGRTMTIGEAWAATSSRVGGLIGVSLLATLILVVAVAVPVFLVVLVAVGADSPGLAFLGIIIALVLAVFIGVSLSMITPAYVLEAIPAMASFGRSWTLVRPSWWRVFGILLLGVIITGIISFVIALPFSFISTALGGPIDPESLAAAPTFAGGLVITIGTILAGTITAPFSAGITGLLYIDQRMRREALDLELLQVANQLGADTQFPPPPTR